MSRRRALIVFAALSASCRGGACARNEKVAPSPECPAKALAANTGASCTLDGKLHEPGWLQAPSSGPFIDGAGAQRIVAHTEIRVLADAERLCVGFYAADDDIRSTDYVGLSAPPLSFELSADGKLRGDGAALPEVKGAVDSDGTMDDAEDDDEEWTAEIAIPWSALGLSGPPEVLSLNATRRDRPKRSSEQSLVWSPPCGGSGFGTLRLPHSVDTE